MEQPEQNKQYGQYEVSPASHMMMLGVGQPSISILERANKFISHPIEDFNVLQYGLKQGFTSYRRFVKQIICDLSDLESEEINENNINENNIYMTNGISHSVFMLASLFRSKYDTIFVEELTYFIMINVFKDLKYNIKTFNINNLEKLKNDLVAHQDGALIYVIPYCNNPTGKSMTMNEIIHFSKILPKNCICFSDETYQFLQFGNSQLNNNSLALYSDNIISLGTFSKILAPGVRLGWLYTNLQYENKHLCDYLDDTGFMDSGGSVNPIMAYMITNNIIEHYKSYLHFLDKIKSELEEKQNIIINTLNTFKDYFEIIKPDGGYFVFVKSLKLNSTRLLELAKQCGLSFHIGNKFAPNKNYDDWFRLSVSYYSKEDFEKYFAHRITNLVKLIDLEIRNAYEVSLFGFGRLGKLIDGIMGKKNIKYNVLTKNFRNEQIGDIIIDVTTPQGSIDLINFLTENKLNKKLIIGTTGHTDDQLKIIKEYAKKNVVVLCPNFSNGIQNMIKMIRNLDKVWETAHIIDLHHINKKDSPSGTALLLKRELEKRYIIVEIVSIRKDEIIGTHIITLKGENEELELKHVAENRDIFATGCINLIEKIKTKPNGLYDFI
jgi:DNA-binding transcriptional MocR family regulator/dihydrodipicolinate reductase